MLTTGYCAALIPINKPIVKTTKTSPPPRMATTLLRGERHCVCTHQWCKSNNHRWFQEWKWGQFTLWLMPLHTYFSFLQSWSQHAGINGKRSDPQKWEEGEKHFRIERSGTVAKQCEDPAGSHKSTTASSPSSSVWKHEVLSMKEDVSHSKEITNYAKVTDKRLRVSLIASCAAQKEKPDFIG